MTSFQTRRNDETDEFVIVLDNLVPVAGLTMKRRGERTFTSELDRE